MATNLQSDQASRGFFVGPDPLTARGANSRYCKDKRQAGPKKPYRRYQGTQQYSIIALTDSSGTIKERYAYTAYGTPTITDAAGTVRSATAEANRYLYTGREYDDVADIYHYRARPYLSRLGRFGSRDPIGYFGDPKVPTGFMSVKSLKPSANLKRIDRIRSAAIAAGNEVRDVNALVRP